MPDVFIQQVHAAAGNCLGLRRRPCLIKEGTSGQTDALQRGRSSHSRLGRSLLPTSCVQVRPAALRPENFWRDRFSKNVGRGESQFMKPFNPIRFALLTAAALITYAAFASKSPLPPPLPSSGTVVLDYLHPRGTFAQNFGLTVAPSGMLYASGAADVDNNLQWNGIVLRSSDQGATWSGPLDDFGSRGFFTDGGVITSDAAGNLYAANIAFDDSA